MADLAVSYLKLKLKNPFLVSSCGLTGSLTGIRRCAEQGAGAVVLQSLFEEQVDIETGLDGEFQAERAVHPEAMDYLTELGKSRGAEAYLELIAEARRAVDIPIIASVNCVSDRWWSEFTAQIQSAGADALELNIGFIPGLASTDARALESRTVQIVRDVKAQTGLPVAVKLGPWFTALPDVVANLVQAGADGIVLFNRFYRLDIDIEQQAFVTGRMYSSPEELHLPLRWIAILSPHISVPISGSTGVHSAADAIKLVLAGAQVVQLASALYTRKINHLGTLIEETADWMDRHDYATLDAFRGRMSSTNAQAKAALGRLQYIKALAG